MISKTQNIPVTSRVIDKLINEDRGWRLSIEVGKASRPDREREGQRGGRRGRRERRGGSERRNWRVPVLYSILLHYHHDTARWLSVSAVGSTRILKLCLRLG